MVQTKAQIKIKDLTAEELGRAIDEHLEEVSIHMKEVRLLLDEASRLEALLAATVIAKGRHEYESSDYGATESGELK